MNFFIHNNSLHALVHATSQKDYFTSYITGGFGNINMSNDGLANAIGIGDVCLSTNNGTALVLISTGKLDNERFCNTFNGG